MAAVDLKVTPEALRTAAGDVRRLVWDLTRDLDEAKSQVDRSQYYWTGGAGDRFRQRFSSRRQEAEELLSLLRKYPSDLLEMANIYEDTEKGNEGSAAKLDTDIIR